MITNPTILAEFDRNVARLLVLVFIDWPTGPVYLHSRIGEKRWDGQTWLGLGELGQISGLENGSQSGRLRLTLHTPDVAHTSEAVRDDAVGRSVKVYLAAMDDSRRITAAQLIAHKWIAATPLTHGKLHGIHIECGGPRERFRNAKNSQRLSSGSWRAQYPNDSYCDDVEELGKGPLPTYTGSAAVGGGGVGGGGRGGDGGTVKMR